MLATLRDFAKLVGLAPSDADEGLRSENSARAVLSRRSFFAAAAAMATATAFSEGGLPDCGFVRLARPLLLPIRQRIHQPFYDTLIRTSGRFGNLPAGHLFDFGS